MVNLQRKLENQMSSILQTKTKPEIEELLSQGCPVVITYTPDDILVQIEDVETDQGYFIEDVREVRIIMTAHGAEFQIRTYHKNKHIEMWNDFHIPTEHVYVRTYAVTEG